MLRQLCCILLLLTTNLPLHAQNWYNLDVPYSPTVPFNRFDDIFFINKDTGWTISSTKEIFKTTNGGRSWIKKFETFNYPRSIKFASSRLGFCGVIGNTFYRTKDGGETWSEISLNFPQGKAVSVCGLSAVTEQVIYGSGAYHGPAYIIKSTDGGDSWSIIDMSAYARALIDIHFIDENRGFVTGQSPVNLDGGIVLYTEDGGQTWTTKLKTRILGDRIWKVQTPDGRHFYGSIEVEQWQPDNPSENYPVTRYVKSVDSGKTWTQEAAFRPATYNIQMIGFMDSLHGYMSGYNIYLLETTNGGISWQEISGPVYKGNRFLKIDDTTAFIAGSNIYKNQDPQLTHIDTKPKSFPENMLKVAPNPATDYVHAEVNLAASNHIYLRLLSAQGEELQVICNKEARAGTHTFDISVSAYAAQTVYISLEINEGRLTKKVIKL